MGESKGVAFVRYATAEGVSKAEAQSGLEFMERKIWIEKTEPRAERTEKNTKSTENYRNNRYKGDRRDNYRNNKDYRNDRDGGSRGNYNRGGQGQYSKDRNYERNRDRERDNKDRERNDDFSIFVGNLNYDTTEETIRDFFDSCGAIKDVRLGKKPNGRSKGFAHVEFEKMVSVKKAIALKDEELDGRQLNIDQSRYREERRNNGYRNNY